MGSLRIEGPLTFATIASHLSQLNGDANESLDLSQCPRIDSAGAAYLLERTRRARARGAALKISHANSQIQNLLHFFGLDNIVELV